MKKLVLIALLLSSPVFAGQYPTQYKGNGNITATLNGYGADQTTGQKWYQFIMRWTAPKDVCVISHTHTTHGGDSHMHMAWHSYGLYNQPVKVYEGERVSFQVYATKTPSYPWGCEIPEAHGTYPTLDHFLFDWSGDPVTNP